MTTASERLHAHLIGRQGSRADLNTPALTLDRAAFADNVARMAAFARKYGVALRPHAKTHKSADIARAQIAAGAVGVCCAKLGEAEALAAEGIAGIHLTSPVVTPPAIARLVALNARSPGLSVVADHPDNVAALARASTAETPLRVLIDIDPWNRRTGVASGEAALELTRAIAAAEGLTYGGVQFYCGSQQHIQDFAERRAAIAERTAYLADILALLSAHDLAPPLVTGGGTGSHVIDAELGVLTELQVGSYIFMDREYGDCDLDGSGTPPFATALTVDASVVSTNAAGMVTIDAGLKAFATEAGPPPIREGAPAGSTYRFMGDEHGGITLPAGEAPPPLGSRIVLATPHCDPTVNLHDAYHVIDGDTLVAIWPVTARGRSA
jgi:D-serine deaminase-like pyridoxal phosphate-dependent protein